MILQGVGHPVPYLGVSYANDPKKGGYMAYAPALDLTTLFEVIFYWKKVLTGKKFHAKKIEIFFIIVTGKSGGVGPTNAPPQDTPAVAGAAPPNGT